MAVVKLRDNLALDKRAVCIIDPARGIWGSGIDAKNNVNSSYGVTKGEYLNGTITDEGMDISADHKNILIDCGFDESTIDGRFSVEVIGPSRYKLTALEEPIVSASCYLTFEVALKNITDYSLSVGKDILVNGAPLDDYSSPMDFSWGVWYYSIGSDVQASVTHPFSDLNPIQFTTHSTVEDFSVLNGPFLRLNPGANITPGTTIEVTINLIEGNTARPVISDDVGDGKLALKEPYTTKTHTYVSVNNKGWSCLPGEPYVNVLSLKTSTKQGLEFYEGNPYEIITINQDKVDAINTSTDNKFNWYYSGTFGEFIDKTTGDVIDVSVGHQGEHLGYNSFSRYRATTGFGCGVDMVGVIVMYEGHLTKEEVYREMAILETGNYTFDESLNNPTGLIPRSIVRVNNDGILNDNIGMTELGYPDNKVLAFLDPKNGIWNKHVLAGNQYSDSYGKTEGKLSGVVYEKGLYCGLPFENAHGKSLTYGNYNNSAYFVSTYNDNTETTTLINQGFETNRGVTCQNEDGVILSSTTDNTYLFRCEMFCKVGGKSIYCIDYPNGNGVKSNIHVTHKGWNTVILRGTIKAYAGVHLYPTGVSKNTDTIYIKNPMVVFGTMTNVDLPYVVNKYESTGSCALDIDCHTGSNSFGNQAGFVNSKQSIIGIGFGPCSVPTAANSPYVLYQCSNAKWGFADSDDKYNREWDFCITPTITESYDVHDGGKVYNPIVIGAPVDRGVQFGVKLSNDIGDSFINVAGSSYFDKVVLYERDLGRERSEEQRALLRSGNYTIPSYLDISINGDVPRAKEKIRNNYDVYQEIRNLGAIDFGGLATLRCNMIRTGRLVKISLVTTSTALTDLGANTAAKDLVGALATYNLPPKDVHFPDGGSFPLGKTTNTTPTYTSIGCIQVDGDGFWLNLNSSATSTALRGPFQVSFSYITTEDYVNGL